MKPYLVDVNVLLALLAAKHEHHKAARKWFDSLDAGQAGLCRVVQLALLRLLNNPSVMGIDAMSASGAWRVMEKLLEDERMEMVRESAYLDEILPGLLVHSMPTGTLIMDAYLAAFAIASSRCLVTFDKGFQQFADLELSLLR